MTSTKSRTWPRRLFFILTLSLAVTWSVLFFSTEILLRAIQNVPGGRLEIKGSIGPVEIVDGKLSLSFRRATLGMGDSQLEIHADLVKVLFCPRDFFKNREMFFSLHADKVKVKSVNEPAINKLLLKFLKSAVLEDNASISEIKISDLTIDVPMASGLLAEDNPTQISFKKHKPHPSWIKKILKLEFAPGPRLSSAQEKRTLLFSEAVTKTDDQIFKRFSGSLQCKADKVLTLKGIMDKDQIYCDVSNRKGDKIVQARGPMDSISFIAKIDPQIISSKIGQKNPIKFKGKISKSESSNDAFFALAPSSAQEQPPLAWGNLEFDKTTNIVGCFIKTGPSAGGVSFCSNLNLATLTLAARCQLPEGIKTTKFSASLPPGKINFACKANPEPEVSLCSSVQFCPTESDNPWHNIFGHLELLKTGQLVGQANFANLVCATAKIDPSKEVVFERLGLDAGSKTLIQLNKNQNPNILQGFANFKLIEQFIPKNVRKNIIGSIDKIELEISQANFSGIKFKTLAQSPTGLLLAKTANPMESFSGQVACDLEKKKITVKDLAFNFSVGKIYSHRSEVKLTQNWLPDSIYAPVEVTNFFFNKDNEFFAIADASFLVGRCAHTDPIKASGQVFLNKSVYKKTVSEKRLPKTPDFLGCIEPNYSSLNADLDVLIKTKEPLDIHTSPLKAKLDLDLKVRGQVIKGKVMEPKLSGNATILSGDVDVLGHKLDIKSGSLKFSESLGGVPFIDALAYGKVKKYALSFHVLGSLTSPNIHLQSSPELNEEQIISLLMSGFSGQETSLMQFLPGILIRQIEDAVTDQISTSPKFGRAIRAVTRPGKALKIAPCLIDSKIDNIGAAVSLDIGNRLHASAKKGVHVKDHLSLQMEYLLSNNLSLKVGRGSQGDVEGELEMKFKF